MALRLFSQQLQNDLILASARGEADKGAQAAREGLLARARARDPSLLPILSRALLEGIKPASPLVLLPQAREGGREGGRAEVVKAEANGVLVWHLQNKALEALVEVWREGRGAKKGEQQQQQQQQQQGGGGGGGEGVKEGGKEGEKEKEKLGEKGKEEKKNEEEGEEEVEVEEEEEGEKGKGKKEEEKK